MTLKSSSSLTTIGSTEYIDIAGYKNIPAKIDTGADSSSIWVSNIEIQSNGTLTFSFFDQTSPLYDGKKFETSEYLARVVRSSNGERQIRYLVKLPITIKGQLFHANFSLANRSRNNFPVLIGRNVLEGNFAVDVSVSAIQRQKLPNNTRLNRELKKDPHLFHHKYIKQELTTKGES